VGATAPEKCLLTLTLPTATNSAEKRNLGLKILLTSLGTVVGQRFMPSVLQKIIHNASFFRSYAWQHCSRSPSRGLHLLPVLKYFEYFVYFVVFQAPLVKAVQTSPSSDLCGLAFLEDLHGYLHDVPDSVEIHPISKTATHLHSAVFDY